MISVIMPVYNVEGYVEDSIASVCCQSYATWELVIINDGSTDGTLAICQRLAATDPRIRVITTENHGVAMARNEGIAAARGELLAFVDSDDIVAPRYLEVMHAAMADDIQIATVAYSSDRRRLDRGTTTPPTRILDAREALTASLYQRDNRGGVNASLWGKLFRRHLFDGLRCTPGILYEDLDMTYRLLLRAHRIATIAATMYYYRVRQGSIIHTFSEHRLSVIAVCERLCQYPEVKASPELLRAAQDRLFSACYNMLILMRRHHHHDTAMTSKCRNYIKQLRRQELKNPHVRLKNRLGALVAYIFL